MADKIQWAGNTMPKSDDKHLGIMSLDHVKKAREIGRASGRERVCRAV